MEIRSASDLDLPQLLAIEEAAQPVPWSMAAFQRCYEANYPAWVAEEEKKIIGFIMISVQAGECHILNLCIHPNFQGKGHGKKLLLNAMAWAKQKGAAMVYLEVRRSNVQAIGLYRQMNFKLIGERKDYYPGTNGKEDALIFARDIGIE